MPGTDLFEDLMRGLDYSVGWKNTIYISSADLPEFVSRLKSYLRESREEEDAELATAEELGLPAPVRPDPDLEDVLGFRGGFFNRGLREARLRLGLTQEELGIATLVMLGRPPKHSSASTMISQLETLQAFPNPEMAQAIAVLLDRPVKELFPPWLEVLQQRQALTEVPVSSLVGFAQLRPREVRALEETLGLIADPAAKAENAIRDRLLAEAVAGLDPLLAEVIRLRFGEDLSIEETATRLGIKVAAARQREARALRELRKPRIWGRLRDYF